MFKFKGKKWKDMRGYDRIVLMNKIYKWALPIRILVFPVALLVKLYKWTYDED